MADLHAALLTQLRNIQAKTGLSLPALHEELAASGLSKHGELRSWLMERHRLGYGDANTVVQVRGKLPAELQGGSAAAAAAELAGDPLQALYSGPKAHLRAVHEAVLAAAAAFGPFEQAPKKAYVSLRRSKQFAMVGPATQGAVEIGLNFKGLPAHPRLKLLPPGGMCQATLRIGSAAEVDAQLVGWLKLAYDAAA